MFFSIQTVCGPVRAPDAPLPVGRLRRTGRSNILAVVNAGPYDSHKSTLVAALHVPGDDAAPLPGPGVALVSTSRGSTSSWQRDEPRITAAGSTPARRLAQPMNGASVGCPQTTNTSDAWTLAARLSLVRTETV
jgi:hypothetical protein